MPENAQLKLLIEQLAAQRVPLAVGAFDTNAALGLAEGDPISTSIRELVDALDDRMERFGYMNATSVCMMCCMDCIASTV